MRIGVADQHGEGRYGEKAIELRPRLSRIAVKQLRCLLQSRPPGPLVLCPSFPAVRVDCERLAEVLLVHPPRWLGVGDPIKA